MLYDRWIVQIIDFKKRIWYVYCVYIESKLKSEGHTYLRTLDTLLSVHPWKEIRSPGNFLIRSI